MRRGGSVIPPGRAGLLVLAVAMVPIAVRRFPRAVRWVGRKLETAGLRVQKTVEETDRFEKERVERREAEETRKSAHSASAEVPIEVVQDEPAGKNVKKAPKTKTSGRPKRSKK